VPQSLVRNIYSRLNYDLADYWNYFQGELGKAFKARVEMLQLKYRPHHPYVTREKQDTQHILVRCSILQEIRFFTFGSTAMTEDELINLINGINWHSIAAYMERAQKYRNKIISEYFYMLS